MSDRRTTVVNIRQQPHEVYIGRNPKGRGPSKWGNPFVVGKPAPERLYRALQNTAAGQRINRHSALSREQAIDLYRESLARRLREGNLTPDDFREIQGKRLGCFCKPQPCHGDIIAWLADWFQNHPDATEAPAAEPGNRPRLF